MRTPSFQNDMIGPHRAFLETLKHSTQVSQSGPFTDGKGGAYLLKAACQMDAENIAYSDPIYTSGSSTVTIHEWDTAPA